MMSRSNSVGMTRRKNGADVLTRNSSQQRQTANRSIRRQYSSESDEEPWDQRKRVGGNDDNLRTRVVITSEQQSPRQQQSVALRLRIVDDDAELDDGDLPSLRNYKAAVVSPGPDVPRSVHPALSISPEATPVSQRNTDGLSTAVITPPPLLDAAVKVWNRPESTSDAVREPRFNNNKPTSRFIEEDSGPHDEMEARRAVSYRKKSTRDNRREKGNAIDRVMKNKSEESTDYAGSRAETSESDSFDDEYDDEDEDYYNRPVKDKETEDEYDHTFCGQTLTALNDFCGGGLLKKDDISTKGKADADPGNQPIGKAGPPIITIGKDEHRSLQQEESEPLHLEETDMSDLHLLRMASEDTQQENTAIEVEFVEGTIPPAAMEKKNALLDAFAKKAKEDFEDTQKKKLVANKNIDGTVNKKEGSLERTIPLQKTFSEAMSETSAKSEDDVYNRMSAAEKRKFLSYINSGNSPHEATQKVVLDRSKKSNEVSETDKRMKEAAKQIVTASQQNRQQITPTSQEPAPSLLNDPVSSHDAKTRLSKRAKENAKRFSFWKRSTKSNDSDESVNVSTDSPVKAASMKVHANNLHAGTSTAFPKGAEGKGIVQPVVENVPVSSAATGGSDLRKGGVLCDATASGEEKEEIDEYDDTAEQQLNPELDSSFLFRSSDRSKKRQFPGVLPIRAKGFEVLKDNEGPNKPSKKKHVSDETPLNDDDKIESTSPEDNEIEKGNRISLQRPLDDLAMKTVAAATLYNIDLTGSQDASELENGDQSQTPQSMTRELADVTTRQVASKGNHSLEEFEETGDDPMTGKDVSYVGKSTEASCEDSTRLSTGSHEMMSRGSDPSDLRTEGSDKLDVSIDAYFNSTNDMVVSPKPASRDGMSVYTMGTSVTAGSTYSQSSRVRRPGAAKARLAKQKEVENKVGKKKGWHASIKAAAASNNRAWDPKKGWVDYHDPDIDAIPDSSVDTSNEKIHIVLDRNVLSPKTTTRDEASSVADRGVEIPFPSQWERERNAMLDGSPAQSRSHTVDKVSSVDESGEYQVEVNDLNVSSSRDGSAEKPKGWLESMKAASAALASAGVQWDPVHGWTKIDLHDSPLVDTSRRSVSGGSSNANYSHDSTQSDFLSEQHYDYEGEEEKRNMTQPRVPRNELSLEKESTAVQNLGSQTYEVYDESAIEKDAFEEIIVSKQTNSSVLCMIEEKEGFAMINVAEDSLPEIKRMKSYDLLSKKAQRAVSTREGSPTFGFSDEIPPSTAIEVVKEKVNVEDMELFGEQKEVGIEYSIGNRSLGNRSLGGNVSRSVVSTESSRDSSTRRHLHGPIDVDDVDETWDSDDSHRRSRGWEADGKSVINTSLDTRSINYHNGEDHLKSWKSRDPSPDGNNEHYKNPNNTVDSGGITENDTSIRNLVVSRKSSLSLAADSRSVISTSTRGSTRSSLNKRVPKLERSKRDTSPISTSRREKSMSTTPAERSNNASHFKNNLSTAVIDERKDDTHISDRSFPSPELDTSRFNHLLNSGGAEEIKSSTGSDSDPAEDRYTYSPEDHRQRTRNHDEDSGLPSSRVKDRLQEWESRIEKSSSMDKEDYLAIDKTEQVPSRSNGSEEWKSFLNKKVLAEKQAAINHKQEESTKALLNRSATKIRNSKGPGREEEDSIFAFQESEVNVVTLKKRPVTRSSLDDISDLSPIQNNYALGDMEKAESEAYGPGEEERGLSNFFQRLSNCAAPVLPQTSTTADNNSPFEFIRSIPQSEAAKRASDFVTNSLKCGHPSGDVKIDESQLTFESEQEESTINTSSLHDDRKRSSPGVYPSSGSVVSEESGVKTAYLEALATRAAVSNPKRSGSKRRERGTGSPSVASGATESSEKWKSFLERKKVSGSFNTEGRSASSSASNVSKAAEKYAAEKVEEMMLSLTVRSKSAPKSTHKHKVIDMMLDTSGELNASTGSFGELKMAHKKGASVKAAEDLAAARVEAMMAALSTNRLDEAEI